MGQSAFKKGFETCSDHRGRRMYIMYHGTTLENARKIKCNGFIRSSDGMLGPGVYVTRSYTKACSYPKHLEADQKRAVLQLSVRVGRVKKIKRQGHPLQKSRHEEGYDTAWVPPKCGMVESGLEESCVWDPNRITVLKILKEDGSTEESSSEESYESYEHGNYHYGNNQNGDYQHSLFQHALYQHGLYRHDLNRHGLYHLASINMASIHMTTIIIADSYHYGGYEDGDC